jgi:hypothetical protein
MNLSAVLVSTLLAALSLPDEGTEKAVLATVKICVESGPAALSITNQAKAIAALMFADIGVKIEWQHRRRDCYPRPEETILINISMDSPASLLPGALAYARPYEGAHIEVFYDRILKIVEPRRQLSLLAHVLVHEVSHILQGVNRHSEVGLMKPAWNESDYVQMSWKPLPFAPEDVKLIQLGLDARTSRVAKR